MCFWDATSTRINSRGVAAALICSYGLELVPEEGSIEGGRRRWGDCQGNTEGTGAVQRRQYKMVRAPCCDKMGIKKGPWTPEEDQILVSFIQRCGHGNWRALPKLAGLMRCGKSCRLRWMNYLRPDIKRGNFSKEDEETIISLHELLGNRWSAIAARLPGRTDNEIKNVWHTHLKKRAKPGPAAQEPNKKARLCGATAEMESKLITLQLDPVAGGAAAAACTGYEGPSVVPASPPQSSSEFSSTATESSTMTREINQATVKEEYTGLSEKFVEMDESFWSDALSLESSVTSMGFSEPAGYLPFNHVVEDFHTNTSSNEDDMDLWLRVLMGVGDLPELPSS